MNRVFATTPTAPDESTTPTSRPPLVVGGRGQRVVLKGFLLPPTVPHQYHTVLVYYWGNSASSAFLSSRFRVYCKLRSSFSASHFKA